jgi:VanZ family protein
VAQWFYQQNLAFILLILWGLFILYGTLLPFDFSASSDLIERRLRQLWERPIRGMGGSWADVYSNVAFFMPWGFLLAIWREKRGSSWWWTLVLALLTGACFSASVELLQLFAPRRVTSLIDLVTNTFGSVVGALLGWPLARWLWPVASVRARQLLLTRPTSACALAVLAAMLFAGILPSYNKTGASGLTAAIKRARLIPFGPATGGLAPAVKAGLWAAEFLTWTLVGGVLALAARESKRDGARAIVVVVGLAAGLSLAVEVLQLVIPGRDVDLTSVALAIFGSAVAATLVIYLPAVDARRWTVPALLVWGLAVMLVSWNPPRFMWPDRLELKPEMVVPFWSYFGSRTLEDLTDVVSQAAAFLPLGALLAARSWRQSFLGVVLIGFSLGAIVELGQVFLPDRTSDVSDAISAAAGAGLGLALWRWGESARTSSMGATRYRVGTSAGRTR